MASGGLLVGTAIHAQAAEVGFLEMLFGARPAPQQAQPTAAPAPAPPTKAAPSAAARLRGSGRPAAASRPATAALPLKIRVKEREISERQTPIDMKAGATAALLKDETLRPGDIVVLNSGARVFTGNPDKRHAIRDFKPVQSSRFVSRGTRKVLAGLFTPVGAVPAQEARRMMARARQPMPEVATPIPAQKTAMRVINPWQGGQ
ncbi:hypothetical protein ACU4GR_14185 [Methylobacterium oryzae CBMB20]